MPVTAEVKRSWPGWTKGGIKQIISTVLAGLRAKRAAIGHLKFLIQAGGTEFKLSFVTLEDARWEERFPNIQANTARLLVNARVEMPAPDLRELFLASLAQSNLEYSEDGVSYFHPKQPAPTHRYS